MNPKEILKKEYEEKKLAVKRRRLEIAVDMEQHPEKILFYKEKCRRDPVFFIDHFIYTYDPRKRPQTIPFILYPFQEDYVREIWECIVNGEDALTEKSRDMGVSWLILAVFVYGWLFYGYDFRVGSRKEEYVDKRGDMDSLFEKMRFILTKMPKGFLPDGWSWHKHDRHMILENPENKSSIVGEATNPNFGVGGRKKAILFDEFAKWACASDAWKKTADTTPCRLPVSTPEGRSNKFANIRHDRKLDIKIKTLHWKLHPYKDQEWYENEKKRRTPTEMAQEIDISYEGSVQSKVYEIWNDVEKGKWQYNPNFPIYTSWDFGNDGTAIIWWQKVIGTKWWRIIDAYINYGKVIDFYVPFITGQIVEAHDYTREDLEVIAEHSGWRTPINFGDPSCKQHQMQYKYSIQEVLEQHNIYIHTNDEARTFKSRYTPTQLLLRDTQVNINPRTQYLDECMINARFPERSDTSKATTEVTNPIHDWTSHFRTAVEYFAVNRPESYEEVPSTLEERFRRKQQTNTGLRLRNDEYSN